MTALLILRREADHAASSPELRYLASVCAADARKVFGSVEEVSWRPAREAPVLEDVASPGAPVLVFGSANVHLGAASLRRMKAAVDDGADVVLPEELSSFPLDEPVYTLRDFELVERRSAAGEIEPRTRRGCHLPVALFSASLVAGKACAATLEALLTDRDFLAREDLAGDLVHAGVFHEFIDYYGEAREDVLPYLPEKTADVLEVGCGRGHTGALLQRRLGCRVTGVELNPEIAREAAGRLHRVIVGDVMSVAIDGTFDAVVATELFEHLKYPESFLDKVKPLLRPGGRIVMSVPNVGHYSIVEDLLAGRWDYLPIGLLCYTHFRFFTRATLASWLERSGFSEYRIMAQTTDLPDRFRGLADRFEIDPESLRTTGFYVVLEVGPG